MMRTKFFLMMLAAIVMGSQVTLFAQEKKGAKSERRQFNNCLLYTSDAADD